MRGVLRPNTLPPGYPTGTNDWVSRIPGWRWLSRRDLTGQPVSINVKNWCHNVYSTWASDTAELRFYQCPWFYSLKSGLILERLGSSGRASPVRNLLADPDVHVIDGGTVYSSDTFFVSEVFSSAMRSGGTSTVEKSGDGVSYLMDPGTGVANQYIAWLGDLPADYRGGPISVSFEAESVGNVACALNQVRVQVYNRGSGSTVTNEISAQIMGSYSIAAGAKVPIYRTITFDMSSFVYGAKPRIGLQIYVNGPTVANTAKVRIRNVSLAIGADNPALVGPR